MPEEDMPGIDYIIPDISYLLKDNKYKNIVGVLITHGHYDHIGAIPYILHRIGNPPVFASPLTKGIILKRQDEFPEQPKLNINEITHGSRVTLGVFKLSSSAKTIIFLTIWAFLLKLRLETLFTPLISSLTIFLSTKNRLILPSWKK